MGRPTAELCSSRPVGITRSDRGNLYMWRRQIGGAVGKGIREFRKGTQELADRTSLTDAPPSEVHSTTAREADVERPGAVPVQPHDREAG